ncbi:MAG: hypothetical protein WBV78_02130 [Roseobacter sp.]
MKNYFFASALIGAAAFSIDIAVELLGLDLFDLAMGPKTKV